MKWLVSNPNFQLLVGSLVGFAGSVVANFLFYGTVEKGRAQRETQRAYNKLMTRLVHTTISDISHPLHLLPLEISDRVEDLKFALEDVNPKFQYVPLVQKAILQAADLRKMQEEQNKGQTKQPVDSPQSADISEHLSERKQNMKEHERRSLVTELAGAVSTQAKVANRAWLSLITVALFAVLPRAFSKEGNVSLPWNIGEVEQVWFHAIAFLILVVLTIFFAAAHAQQIRAQRLAQTVVDSLVVSQISGDIIHPRELFDMLRMPSLNRIAPLAQLLRGKYQFYVNMERCPAWLRIISTGYYGAIKLVSYLVFFCLPAWALWRAYGMVSLTGWWRVLFTTGGCVAVITLLQVLLTDAIYTAKVLQHLWKESAPLRR